MAPSISQPTAREHTFRTGRTAVIRDVLSAAEVYGDPDLEDARLAADAERIAAEEAGIEYDEDDPGPKAIAAGMVMAGVVARKMLVKPRIADPGEDVPDGSEEVCTLGAFYDDELGELMELWQSHQERAATFREKPSGGRSVGSGKTVGNAAKRPPRNTGG